MYKIGDEVIVKVDGKEYGGKIINNRDWVRVAGWERAYTIYEIRLDSGEVGCYWHSQIMRKF